MYTLYSYTHSSLIHIYNTSRSVLWKNRKSPKSLFYLLHMLCKSYPFNHIYSLSTHCIFLFINFNHAKLLTTNDHFVSVLSFPLFVLHTAVTFVHFSLFAPKCFYFLYSTKKGIPYWVYTGRGRCGLEYTAFSLK